DEPDGRSRLLQVDGDPAADLAGRRLGNRHLPGRAAEHRRESVRGGGGGRRGALAAAVARDAARCRGHHDPAADPADGDDPARGLQADPAAARRGRAGRRRGPGHLRLLLRCRRRPVGRHRRGRPHQGHRGHLAGARRQPAGARLWAGGSVPMSVEGRPAWLEPATGPERLGKVVILTLILIAVVYPFLNVLSTSLATEQELVESGGLVLVPRSPSLDAYRTVFESGVIPRAIVVSLCVTAVGTAVSLLVTIGMAYGLSRPVVGQRPLLMMALFTLLFTP